MAITLELSDEQAKTILIVMGNCAGAHGSRGVYDLLRTKLRVIGDIPEPRIIHKYETFIVDNEMIQSIRTM